MSNKNLMKVSGKTLGNENAYITINLADDKSEVRGFGKPVTRDRAKVMAEEYFKACEAGWKVLQEIQENSAYQVLRNMEGYDDLRNLIDPANQTVSGVFGKEIILQILAMKNCEGLRYVYGKDNERNTVILIGVQDKGMTKQPDGSLKATSEPFEVTNAIDADNIPIDGEVHDDSLTIAGVRQMLATSDTFNGEAINVLFGPF